MSSKRVVWMSVALVFCASFVFTGCERLGLRKKNTLTEFPPPENFSNLPPTEVITPESQPSHDAFANGARVAEPFENVLFDFDSAQIAPAERSKLEAVGNYMKAQAGTVVILDGNCDERGSAEYNMSLGERRALAARAYLMNLGIDGARIQTRSFGEEKPLNPGHDEEAWRVNRRVEFEVLH